MTPDDFRDLMAKVRASEEQPLELQERADAVPPWLVGPSAKVPLIGEAFDLGPAEYDAIAATILRVLAEDPDVEAATYDPEQRVINVTLTGKAQGYPCTITIGEKGSP